MSDGLTKNDMDTMHEWPQAVCQAKLMELSDKLGWWINTCNWWREKCQEAWRVRACQATYITYLENELLKERGET